MRFSLLLLAQLRVTVIAADKRGAPVHGKPSANGIDLRVPGERFFGIRKNGSSYTGEFRVCVCREKFMRIDIGGWLIRDPIDVDDTSYLTQKRALHGNFQGEKSILPLSSGWRQNSLLDS